MLLSYSNNTGHYLDGIFKFILFNEILILISLVFSCYQSSNKQLTNINSVNSSPPGQNGHHFADDIFECIFMNAKFGILDQILLKFVP